MQSLLLETKKNEVCSKIIVFKIKDRFLANLEIVVNDLNFQNGNVQFNLLRQNSLHKKTNTKHGQQLLRVVHFTARAKCGIVKFCVMKKKRKYYEKKIALVSRANDV